MSKESKVDPLFNDDAKVQLTYQKWEKVGDSVKGVLVEKRKNNNIDQWGHKSTEYILMTEEGKRVCVSGRAYPKGTNRVGEDFKVIFGMSEIPLGAVMGFVYDRDMENPNGNPAKIIEPRYLGEKDEAKLKEYQAKWASEDETTVVESTQVDDIDVDFDEDTKVPSL